MTREDRFWVFAYRAASFLLTNGVLQVFQEESRLVTNKKFGTAGEGHMKSWYATVGRLFLSFTLNFDESEKRVP